MKKEEIITKIKRLNLPKRSYVVYGSAPLAIAGLREANDIDLLVSGELFKALEERGWKEIYKGPNDTPITHGDFEAHDSWGFSSYCPTLEELLERATEIDGIPFASLEDVKEWKAASGRPKDLIDIELIDKYRTETRVTNTSTSQSLKNRK